MAYARRGQGYGQLMGWHGKSRPMSTTVEIVKAVLKGQARWRPDSTRVRCPRWPDKIAEVA